MHFEYEVCGQLAGTVKSANIFSSFLGQFRICFWVAYDKRKWMDEFWEQLCCTIFEDILSGQI
jgi:CRISPR/Cas system-associated protein Cas10 (large subunit of type III CRISPR-Cas system)